MSLQYPHKSYLFNVAGWTTPVLYAGMTVAVCLHDHPGYHGIEPMPLGAQIVVAGTSSSTAVADTFVLPNTTGDEGIVSVFHDPYAAVAAKLV